MSAAEHNLDELLAMVADGRLDELSPEQVAALEMHLDASPAAADLLADVTAEVDSPLDARVQSPTAAEWDAVWDRVDSAASSSDAGAGVRWIIKLWQPLSAAACVFLMLMLWRDGGRTEQTDWPIQLADQVVVHEIQVYGDADAFVDYAANGKAPVIWLLDDEGV